MKNGTNDTCVWCGRPTVPLFQSGKMKWCPICEGSQTKKTGGKPIVGEKTDGADLDDDIAGYLDWGRCDSGDDPNSSGIVSLASSTDVANVSLHEYSVGVGKTVVSVRRVGEYIVTTTTTVNHTTKE